ncbi:helix-turn-helix domain-containing protein [Piscirickettsia salmonis]|uniref:helix-turn-helix domain-containing protein n=1 Tax=Piscirickettsia salmonis TaxID=1238 RepID=UPI0007C8A9C1|nr:hypothetical protein A0O36_00399 [Piscirickettsiaceae bacterium NZ-RLO1]
MSLINVVCKKNTFAQIDKACLYDSSISLKAKGLLAILLSFPQDWKIRVKDLCQRAKDQETAVRSGLNELIKTGYAKRSRVTDDKGRVIRWDFYVFEEKQQNENTTLRKPQSGATLGFPKPGKGQSISNNDNSNNNINIISPYSPPRVDELLSHSEALNALIKKYNLGCDDLELEAERFVSHYSSIETNITDWEAKFKAWVLNKPKRQSPDPVTDERKTQPSVTAIEKQKDDLETGFDEFWKAYPIKKDKRRARNIWVKKKLDDIGDEIISHVKQAKINDQGWIDGFVPHPSTYLNGERWNDEIIKQKGNQHAGNLNTYQQFNAINQQLENPEYAAEIERQIEENFL